MNGNNIAVSPSREAEKKWVGPLWSPEPGLMAAGWLPWEHLLTRPGPVMSAQCLDRHLLTAFTGSAGATIRLPEGVQVTCGCSSPSLCGQVRRPVTPGTWLLSFHTALFFGVHAWRDDSQSSSGPG